jgi:hypothetical protein
MEPFWLNALPGRKKKSLESAERNVNLHIDECKGNIWGESYWIAERLAPLRAMRVARVRGPAKPTISVERLAFSVTLRPGARHKHYNCAV